MPERYRDFDREERDLVRRAGLDRMGCPAFDLVLAARAGVLEQAQATPLLSHLESCRFCQALCADFAQGESSSATLENRERIRARLDRAIAKPIRGPWYRRWEILAAAAGAVACLSVAVQLRRTPAPHPASSRVVIQSVKPQFFLKLTAPPVKLSLNSAITWRGEGKAGGDGYLKELGDALAPYRAADYGEAASRLGKLAGKYPESAEAAFYHGVSLLLSDRASEAKGALERAESLHPQALREDVEWFLSAASERTGNPEQAAVRLRKMCEAAGAYREQACSALPHLR
ncbi:MAG: hypothetical protein JNK48_23125 [Bryobacterales bacterium]|nr:hypothetical protein [Bryobacterales bacterium]